MQTDIIKALEAASKTWEDRAAAIEDYQRNTDDVDVDDTEEKDYAEGVAFGLYLAIRAVKGEDIASLHAEHWTPPTFTR